MAFSLRFAAHSEVGRVRKNNQDSGYASPTMLLVTDGMGGAAAGDLASAVAALEAARSDHRAADGEEMLERVAGMIARANTKLSELIEEDLELDGMGTTFCGAMFNGEQFGLAHIGDSRGYLLRDGTLTQITHDHSWVQSLLDEGKITAAQAATHPHRSLILKVLNGQVEFEPDLDLLDARLGDRIMFCSDGLSGLVDDATLLQIIRREDPVTAIASLAERANANGGHDNITIVMADVVEHDDALDARAGVLVGAATELDVPRTGELALRKDPGNRDPRWPQSAKDVVVEHDASEVARYAPHEPRRRWPGVTAMILAIALVLGGGTWAVYAYSQTRYFVAADDGFVAIYNGLPGSLLGADLNTLTERTDIRVTDLPPFYQRVVDSTIQVDGIAAAESTTEQLRGLAERCVEVRRERQQPTPQLSPSPSASVSPSPAQTIPGLPTTTLSAAPSGPSSQSAVPSFLLPTEIVTATPTASEEADPEAC
ncbi:PP2C family protein-serine/threonine phosphatase [Tessaracoccus sp. Z1128]